MRTHVPKISLIGVIVVLLIAGAVMILKQKPMAPQGQQSPSSSDSPTLAANAEVEKDQVEYYDGSTNTTASGSATPIPKPPVLTTYIYPGSQTKSSTAAKLELESNASPQLITEWYKNKIRDLNFNAKSFSQTTTNGDVLNKLSAAKPGEKLDITIKKAQNDSKVLITVDRS